MMMMMMVIIVTMTMTTITITLMMRIIIIIKINDMGNLNVCFIEDTKLFFIRRYLIMRYLICKRHHAIANTGSCNCFSNP